MPFRSETGEPVGRLPYGVELPPENDPGMFELLGAAWRQENAIGAALEFLVRDIRPGFREDHLHRPLDVIKGTRYEYDYLDKFVGSRSEEETRDIMARIDAEERDRETLAAGGIAGLVFGAGIGALDPTLLVPGGLVVRGARGVRLARSALATAGVIGGSTIAQELVLQGTQELRSAEESVISVSAATVLGAILGGAAAHLTRGELEQMAETMVRQVESAPAPRAEPRPAEPSVADEVLPPQRDDDALAPGRGGGVPTSAGAMATPRAGPLTPASAGRLEVNVAGRKVQVDVGKSLAGLSPVTRLQHSVFDEARRAVRQLSDAGTRYEENARLVPTVERNASGELVRGEPEVRSEATAAGGTVETRVKLWDAPMAEVLTGLDLAYARYFHGKNDPSWFEKARAPLQSEWARLFGRNGGKFTFKEFKEEVGAAALRGDQHPIPEVAEAAAAGRARLVEPLFKKAQELGIVIDDDAISIPKRIEVPPDTTPELRAAYDKINARATEAERLVERRKKERRPTSDSYRHRVYNNQKIDEERPKFIGTLVRHFQDGQVAAEFEAEKAARNIFDLETDVYRMLGEYDRFVESQRTALQKQRKKVRQTELAIARTQGKYDTAIDTFRDARRRAEQLQPDELDPDVDRVQLSRELRHVRSGEYRMKALELLEFVRREGGIHPGMTDSLGRLTMKDIRAGDLRAQDAHRHGLIRAKGRDIDWILKRAIEDGYLHESASIDDLVESITMSLRGNKRYSMYDEAEIEYRDRIADYVTEIRRQELDPFEWSLEEYNAFLKGNLNNFRPPTRANIAAHREAERQFTRLAKRRENIGAARRRVEEWHAELQRGLIALEEARPEVKKTADGINAAIRGLRKEIRAQRILMKEATDFAELSPEELHEIAQGITNKIQGETVRAPDLSLVPGPRGPLRARTLRIKDLKIERWLESDIERVWRRQKAYMAADIALAEKFDGDPSMMTTLQRLLEEFNRRSAGAKSEAVQRQLKAEYEAAVRDIEALRDRVRGVYGLPDDPSAISYRAARVAMSLNYVRLLGGMSISALTDPGRVIMRYGLLGAFRDGFLPFMHSLSTARLAAREVKAAGTGLDMVLDTRALSIADLWDDFQRHTKFERAVEGVSARFGLVSLMAPWNAAMKQITGVAAMSEILRAARAVSEGSASVKQVGNLAAAGIDRRMAAKIWGEFQAARGVQRDGVYLPNTEGWRDLKATEAFRAAIVREVDTVIVTPGLEKPLWMSKTWGKLLGQFKSFAFSSNQRLILAGLQQRDAAALSGLMSMIALGALSWQAKAWARGEDTSEYGPARWATEAIDNSGILGIFGEVNAITEKVTAGRIGLSAISGEQLSRYRSRSPIGSLLGPSYDLVESLARVPGAITAGEATGADVRALRQVLPFQNLFYLRGTLDRVEGAVTDALGIQPRRQAD